MLRCVLSYTLSLLMIAVMAYGGCLSCERYYMFPTLTKQAGAGQSCCKKQGRCARVSRESQSRQAALAEREAAGDKSPEAPVEKECKRVAVELNEAQADSVLPLEAADSERLALQSPAQLPSFPHNEESGMRRPDFSLLFGVFRI